MSTQNEMRRVRLTNLYHQAKQLRTEIEGLARNVAINLDVTLVDDVANLPIPATSSEMDSLVLKWADLIKILPDISRLEKELA